MRYRLRTLPLWPTWLIMAGIAVIMLAAYLAWAIVAADGLARAIDPEAIKCSAINSVRC
jgi:hypothetical protein